MVKYCQSTVLKAIKISISNKLRNEFIKKLAYDFHKS